MKKNLLILIAVLVASGLSWGAETPDESPAKEITQNRLGLELLPRGRPFRLTFADPREIRMALSFEGESRIDAAIGNYFSIFALRPVDENSWTFHMGLEGAGYFTMRQADKRFPLETADGLIGMYFEGSRGPWQTQVRYTHVSAHLADGSTATAIPYSRETLVFRMGYVPSQQLQIYGGIHYIANRVPAVHPWGAQFGVNYFGNLDWSLVPFVGTDLQWREETPYNPNFSLILGVALNNPPEAYRSFRFFYSYYTGGDTRGQYYDRTNTFHSIGIEMQI